MLEIFIISAIVGALFELDNFYIGIYLIAQPIITGAVAGLIFGDMTTGVVIGSVVQLIWANTPPVGAYVPPSSSAIAFAATSAAILIKQGVNPVIFVPADASAVTMYAILVGIGTGFFVGQMDIWNRQLNTQILHLYEKKIVDMKERYIVLIQIVAGLSKFLRDVVLYAVFFLVVVPFSIKVFNTLHPKLIQAFKFTYWMLPALGFAVVYEMFRTKKGEPVFGVILICSYLLFSTYGTKLNTLFFYLILLAVGCFAVYNTIWKKQGKEK